jgi:hypothetical protein
VVEAHTAPPLPPGVVQGVVLTHLHHLKDHVWCKSPFHHPSTTPPPGVVQGWCSTPKCPTEVCGFVALDTTQDCGGASAVRVRNAEAGRAGSVRKCWKRALQHHDTNEAARAPRLCVRKRAVERAPLGNLGREPARHGRGAASVGRPRTPAQRLCELHADSHRARRVLVVKLRTAHARLRASYKSKCGASGRASEGDERGPTHPPSDGEALDELGGCLACVRQRVVKGKRVNELFFIRRLG